MDNSNKLEVLKHQIRSTLLADGSGKAMTLMEFKQHFERDWNSNLAARFSECGYDGIRAALRGLSDVVRVDNHGPSILLFPVQSRTTSHVMRLIDATNAEKKRESMNRRGQGGQSTRAQFSRSQPSTSHGRHHTRSQSQPLTSRGRPSNRPRASTNRYATSYYPNLSWTKPTGNKRPTETGAHRSAFGSSRYISRTRPVSVATHHTLSQRGLFSQTHIGISAYEAALDRESMNHRGKGLPTTWNRQIKAHTEEPIERNIDKSDLDPCLFVKYRSDAEYYMKVAYDVYECLASDGLMKPLDDILSQLPYTPDFVDPQIGLFVILVTYYSDCFSFELDEENHKILVQADEKSPLQKFDEVKKLIQLFEKSSLTN